MPVAFLALAGAALAFVLGGFQSGTGSVDKFDTQLIAARAIAC
ncbi:MAG: hypothetical protein P8N02_13375 [Actinomycetota bacterium]|nr:hypothetical protein [Actinomycetota bacterium]